MFCHGTPDTTPSICRNGRAGRPRRIATRAEINASPCRRAGADRAAGSQPRGAHVALEDDRLVVNPGSVGLPADTDDEPVTHSTQMGAPHARYAVLERKKASDPWRMTFRVVAYDWEGAGARAAAKGRADWALGLRTGCAPERSSYRSRGMQFFHNPEPALRGRGEGFFAPLASKIRTISPKPRRRACCSGVTFRGPRC